ncbi:MAG TPA: hypothetical protein VKX16_00550 [Chloroflexota bacterium]|nr:hypothetical protein [Chloroflexota bacterium]
MGEAIGVDLSAQRRDRFERVGLAFFWLLILAYGFFIPSIISWNTESHLYPAFSLVDHGTMRIDAYQQGLGDKSYYAGHYYTDKAPGLSFLAVPVYAAIRLAFPGRQVKGFALYKHIKGYYYIPEYVAYVRYAITYLLIALPSAALGVLLWFFLMRLTGRPGWSLAVAATYSLGTIAYVFSMWYFSHQLTAVLLFGAFLLLFYRVRGRPPDRAVLGTTAAAGFLCGYSIISEYPTIIIVAALAVYLLVVSRQRIRAALAFGAGMVPPAALNIGYNLKYFGKPLATSYMYVHSAWYHQSIHGGILGLASPTSYGVQAPSLNTLYQITFGLYRGIFVVSPVLILFVAGAYFMWKRRDLRAEWWLCVAIVVVYFLVDASRAADTNGWSGGSSVASRHLTPILPFMMVPIAFGFASRLYRTLFAVLATISIALLFMIVSSTYPFPFNDSNPLFNEVFPNFFGGHQIPNWVYVWRATLGITGFPTLLPFFAAAALLVGRIVWLLRDAPAPLWSREASRAKNRLPLR